MAESDILPADLLTEIGKFDAAADEIIQSIGLALNAREPPPIIYHYTNDAGLRGILENGTLWLTDIFDLNDPSELSHGFSQAASILTNRAAGGHQATKVFAQAFEKFETQLQASAYYFVGSFSSLGDELGQWRAYADNGRVSAPIVPPCIYDNVLYHMLGTLRMGGVLDLTEPAHLMAKLEHELTVVAADHGNSYAAINALRDAYHLREWIWHDRLEHDLALQASIMSVTGTEDTWNRYVNQHFPDFPVIRDLCNGSKHFETQGIIRATHRAGWDSPVSLWDNPHSGWDDKGFHVQVGGRFLSIADLLTRVCDFWRGLFAQFPQLG